MRKRATRKLRSSFPVPSLFRHTVRIGELAIEHRLPTMFIQKDYVRAGGLMSYGVDFVVMCRRAIGLRAHHSNHIHRQKSGRPFGCARAIGRRPGAAPQTAAKQTPWRLI